MHTKWMEQGVLKRKDAIKLGRYWTALGPRYSFRIEDLGHKDYVRAYLKITPQSSAGQQ